MNDTRHNYGIFGLAFNGFGILWMDFVGPIYSYYLHPTKKARKIY
jgi:hypothetical protein